MSSLEPLCRRTYHTIFKLACPFYNGKVCPPATSEAGARRTAIMNDI
jgi:hypothetical protein